MTLKFVATETIIGDDAEAAELDEDGNPLEPFELRPLGEKHRQGGQVGGREGAPRGNFSPYKSHYPEAARGYALLGATNPQIGRMFGVTGQTVENWIGKHKQFRDAIEEGRNGADAKAMSALYRRVCGMKIRHVTIERETKTQADGTTVTTVKENERIEEIAPDTTAALRWLAARQDFGTEPPVVTVERILEVSRLAKAEAERRGISFRRAIPLVQEANYQPPTIDGDGEEVK
jgi:hypothetical protein